MVTGEIVHGFENESIDAKAEWFRGLSVSERLETLAAYYDLAVALNPKLREGLDAGQAETSVRILELPPG